MGEFIAAGYAERLDKARAGIHIGISPSTVTYEILISAISDVLVYGTSEDLYRRVQQTTLDGSDSPAAVLQPAGTISLSKTKVSAKVQIRERLYVINADALRDAMRGKIPRATVSEVIPKQSNARSASLA